MPTLEEAEEETEQEEEAHHDPGTCGNSDRAQLGLFTT